ETGVFIDNSPNNIIGGATATPGTGAGNLISGNSASGIQVFGVLSAGNLVAGNAIGTNLAGNDFPPGSREAAPAQGIGVLLNSAPGNLIGGTSPGAANVISANSLGIEISGLSGTNSRFSGSQDLVQGNLIGTDSTGMSPVPNLDLGIFINNAQGN